MIIWKKKSKIEKFQHFFKDLNLLIKQFYLVVWSIEKIQKIKTQKLWIKEKQWLYQKEQYVTLKNQELFRSGKLVGY